MILEIERLILRRYKASDLQDLYEYLSKAGNRIIYLKQAQLAIKLLKNMDKYT